MVSFPDGRSDRVRRWPIPMVGAPPESRYSWVTRPSHSLKRFLPRWPTCIAICHLLGRARFTDGHPRLAAGSLGVDGDDPDHLVRARCVPVLACAHSGEPDLAVAHHHALPVREQCIWLLGLHGASDVVVEDLAVPSDE